MTTTSNIPEELRRLPKWLQYYLKPDPTKPDKKPTKHPCVQYAAPEHKANLRTLDHLFTRPKQAGFQWLVDKQDGFICVDIDHCRNPQTGEITEAVRQIVDALDTYCEISASGAGLHLVCRGTLPEDFHVEGNPVEVYSGNIPNKLIAMTGDLLEWNYCAIQNRQEDATALLKQLQDTVRPQAVPQDAFEEKIVLVSMADVVAKPVEWLWPERIPLSAISAFSGDPDRGKTTAYCDLAARVSRGGDFPDVKMPKDAGGEVLMFCAEDDYARKIKPCLTASGAVLRNIYYVEKIEIRSKASVSERMFSFDQDVANLDAVLSAPEAHFALVIIDPISSYFGKRKMNDKQDVHYVLGQLAALAEKHRIAILIVEHFAKQGGRAAIHKIGGSVAITGVCRSAFMFDKDPEQEGRFVMHFIKGNLSKRKVGLYFTIVGTQILGLGEVPYVVWGKEAEGTADDLLRAKEGLTESRRCSKAADFLKEFLVEAKASTAIFQEADKRGISRNAIFEAKKVLNIGNAYRVGGRNGEWWWPAISQEARQPEDCHALV